MVQGSGEDDAPPEGELGDEEASVEEFSEADELSGKPGRDSDKEGMPHTVLDVDRPDIDLGNMVFDSTNNNATFFTPEILMERFVQNYRNAKELYGERLIRQLTGYAPEYVEKNLRIPEFERHLSERIKQNFGELLDQGVVTREGTFSDEAIEMAAVVMAVQELDHLSARGLLGRRVHKRRSVEGVREESKPFRGEPFRAINVAQSVKTALRRGHSSLTVQDLRSFEREARGSANIIYAVDASGSMKGQKIAQAKRAGVALAYRAISENDRVGLLVFGKHVDIEVPPGKDFSAILHHLVRLRPGSETDIAGVVEHALDILPRSSDTNHLILLTDALPTIGSDPEHEVLSRIAEASAAGLSVSVIGIGLDARGEQLARRIVEIGNGRLSVVKDLEELDAIVLEEYDRLRAQ